MAGRDITEGRAERSIAVDVGVVASTAIWQNTDMSYDVALGGLPFIYAINDSRPYVRQTAPFRKEQFDNQTEPGEQSLTGWWIRSQTSFHSGAGIKFFDPATTDDTGHYRFADSRNVNVWEKGEVTLLKSTSVGHITTGSVKSNGRPAQMMRSIEWNGTKGVLLLDEYDVDKLDSSGNETHFINYNAGTGVYPVYAICDDGTTAYWATNATSGGTTKFTVYGKPLTGSSASTADEFKVFDNSQIVSNAIIDYVKERLIICADNKVYESATAAASTPTLLFTHPSSSHVYTSIAASGTAIYIAGYNGIQSTIERFVLSSTGTLPTLTSAIVSAELPVGEIVHKIYYYLGYMMIGTNKGVRAATVLDNGSITYGPLIVETDQPCYDFAARDRFIWCATSVDGEPGTIRLDLSNEVAPLRFAWAYDVYYSGVTGRHTTACAFADGTTQLVFCSAGLTKGTLITNKQLTSNVATLTTSTAHGLSAGDAVWIEGVDATFNSTTGTYTVIATPTTTTFTYAKTAGDVASTAVSSSIARVQSPGSSYIESATVLAESGYLTTGNIRYGTLEPKNYKRLLGRGDFTYGSMVLETVDKDGIEYDHITYNATVSPIEVATSTPATAQEYVAYKFVLYRDGTDTTKGPTFKGYQAKATIATPRQRVMQFPVYCFDIETDRYNSMIGYTGRAFERILALEDIEESGDVVTWQDLTTGESRQAVIEQVSFTRMTPPDRNFDGFGGVIQITIRTV